MRIAQITNLKESVPPINQHGLEQVVFDLTEELVKMGHEVTLFSTADSKTSAKLVPIWPHALARDPYGSYMDSTTYSLWSVAEAFHHYREFDIIHDHGRFVAGHLAGIIPTPVVLTVHHPISFEFTYKQALPQEYHPYFEHVWKRRATSAHTVVVSQFQASLYPAESTVIYNGLPLEKWPYSPQPGKYLAFLGYITADKGVAQAIQAVLPTDKTLLIAGPRMDTGPDKQYFDREIAPYLNERIRYVGPLNFEEKKKFLAEAQATLMPVQWDEPFGLVAIESLACGTPVVAWDRAALPEIIEDGVSGFLVNSVSQLTQKISMVDQLSRQATRKRVEEKFSARQMAQNYLDLYTRLATTSH